MDLSHINSDSDSEFCSKNTMISQNTGSGSEIHVKSIKKAQHTSDMTNAGNKEKQTIDVSAQKHLSNLHKAIQYNMYQCKICFEAWPLKGKVKSKSAYICKRCSSDKQIPKKFSAGNQMIPSCTCIPNELQDLTQIEEMLIARALPIMNVYVKPGGQRGFSGHCINLPQQVSELAQSLPRYSKHVSLLLVTMNGKDKVFKDVIVRRSKVQQALIWLIQNNPHYTNVTLNLDSLQSLPVNELWRPMKPSYRILKQAQIPVMILMKISS